MKILRPFVQMYKRFTGLNENQSALLRKYMGSWWDGAGTASGQTITVENGLQQDVVHTSIKRIADALAMTPWPVFEREDRGRRKATEHPTYRVLNRKANQDMTAFTWKHLTAVHVLGWGNAFSEIERNGRSDIIALNPMHPADVKIAGRRPTGELVYEWTNKEQKAFLLPASRVLHIKGYSFDGVMGLSPIMHLRETIGRAKAREEFQSRFYSNGASPGGVVTTAEELTDEQLEQSRKSFEQMFSGSSNAHKLLLLQGTQDYKPLMVNPRDAEFIDTARLDAARIAALFGVPLQLINDSSSQNRASTEQLFREFLTIGLNVWFSNFEGQVNVALFSEAEQERLYTEFLRESLIQADTQVLVQALKDEVLTAILTPNEARGRLNLNPMEGGDTLLAPVNMMPLGKLGAPRDVSLRADGTTEVRMHETRVTESPKERSRTSRRKAIRAAKPLLEDAFDRIGKRERKDVLRQAKKSLRAVDDFTRWLDDFYAEDKAFAEFVRKVVGPIGESLRRQIREDINAELDGKVDSDGKDFVREYLKLLAFRYINASRRQLQKLAKETSGDADPFDAIEQRLNEWEATRATKAAEEEGPRLGNGLARALYASGGVTALVWRTTSNACPICNELDGKKVGIRERFLSKGDKVEGKDVAPLKTESDVFHPPLHQGCDCELVPE